MSLCSILQACHAYQNKLPLLFVCTEDYINYLVYYFSLVTTCVCVCEDIVGHDIKTNAGVMMRIQISLSTSDI